MSESAQKGQVYILTSPLHVFETGGEAEEWAPAGTLVEYVGKEPREEVLDFEPARDVYSIRGWLPLVGKTLRLVPGSKAESALSLIKPRDQWEHFGGDPAALVERDGNWFDGDRKVAIVAGGLPVRDPTTLTRSMSHFHYLNPKDFQEYDVFLVYKDTFVE